MRLTQDALLKIVQSTVNQRARSDRSLLAVFLCGSILGDEYLIGGSTDIDLFFIHSDPATVDREIVPLTGDIHLDIAHWFQRDIRQTRNLRIHPWLGPTINRCRILLDPQHFLDFVQASVRGQFDRSDYVLMRARSFYEFARQKWSALQTRQPARDNHQPGDYLRALFYAANAIASLNGDPLTERRFLLQFAARAAAVQRPGLYQGLLGLLGAPDLDVERLGQWLSLWQAAYDAIPERTVPVRLHPGRKIYYLRAIESQLKSTQPMNCLWLLLYTWALAAAHLAEDSVEFTSWDAQMNQVGLSGSGFQNRLAALDVYLDQIDEILENWAQSSGADVV
jgi:hypothetical protein